MSNKILVGVISTVGALCLASSVQAKNLAPEACAKLCPAVCKASHPKFKFIRGVTVKACRIEGQSGGSGSGNHTVYMDFACGCKSTDGTVNVTLSVNHAEFKETAN